MGKFSDTKYISTIDKLVDTSKSKLNNPYYVFVNEQPTRVVYYAQNIERSTLDEASGLNGSNIGNDSPFKFNKIKDFIMYGIDSISTEYDVGDSGVEAGAIAGDAIILPNTITPRPGDYFKINYLKEKNLFKINGVTPDTLDSGANIYKVEYSLCSESYTEENLDKQVEKSFNFIVNNIGTDFKTVIQDCDFDLIKNLEDMVEYLVICFDNLFFNSSVQTFTYNHDGWNMYDPFMIEFFIRNKVLSYGDKYYHVAHATSTNKTFGMDYTKTFFYSLEEAGRQDINCKNLATAEMINDINSLFATRMEYYYAVNYNDKHPWATRFQVINTDIIDHIKSGELYEKGNDKELYNLWISYFNNNKDFIRGNILNLVKSVDFMDNLECFYALAITIFVIEKYIEMLLK